jgi:HD-GYP domain-containing protein (c-di-GMP phosphodiesterase class II)
VAAYALLIADELGLDDAARNEVRWAGLLHDVGKIDVPREILNRPGGLDAHEWAVMSSHPAAGVARVEPLRPWPGVTTESCHTITQMEREQVRRGKAWRRRDRCSGTSYAPWSCSAERP